jgi:hypothetical protein
MAASSARHCCNAASSDGPAWPAVSERERKRRDRKRERERERERRDGESVREKGEIDSGSEREPNRSACLPGLGQLVVLLS